MQGDLLGTQFAIPIRVVPHIARSAYQMGQAIVGYQPLFQGYSHHDGRKRRRVQHADAGDMRSSWQALGFTSTAAPMDQH